jgi:hypothetical protein
MSDMTEAEWLACTEAWQPLLYVRQYASVRRLRLVAAAYARWLQSLPAYANDRPFADLIEEVADQPKSRDELELRAYGLPGSGWLLSHALGPDDTVGQAVSKLVWYAQGTEQELSQCRQPAHARMIRTLREIFGNPFCATPVSSSWLAWHGGAIPKMAQSIYDSRAFDRLPLLADALEDAGCDNADILSHCRMPGEHVRGCWVVDLLLGKS